MTFQGGLVALAAVLVGAGLPWLGMQRRVEQAYRQGQGERKSDVSALEQQVEMLRQLGTENSKELPDTIGEDLPRD